MQHVFFTAGQINTVSLSLHANGPRSDPYYMLPVNHAAKPERFPSLAANSLIETLTKRPAPRLRNLYRTVIMCLLTNTAHVCLSASNHTNANATPPDRRD